MPTDFESEARELVDRMLHDSSNHSWAKRTELIAQALRKAEARTWREAAAILAQSKSGQLEERWHEFNQKADELERWRT